MSSRQPAGEPRCERAARLLAPPSPCCPAGAAARSDDRGPHVTTGGVAARARHHGDAQRDGQPRTGPTPATTSSTARRRPTAPRRPPCDAGAGKTKVKVGQPVAGLLAGATYHYRIVGVPAGKPPILGARQDVRGRPQAHGRSRSSSPRTSVTEVVRQLVPDQRHAHGHRRGQSRDRAAGEPLPLPRSRSTTSAAVGATNAAALLVPGQPPRPEHAVPRRRRSTHSRSTARSITVPVAVHVIAPRARDGRHRLRAPLRHGRSGPQRRARLVPAPEAGAASTARRKRKAPRARVATTALKRGGRRRPRASARSSRSARRATTART